MNRSFILVAAANCTKSPSNVRTSSNPAKDAQLEANIAERGILQNLIGVPVSRKKGHYRITAGGRRLDRTHALIEKGVFPADYQIPLMVVASRKDEIEISLSENFFREDMNPADACRAFQDIIDTEGKTIADVARRFGLTERFVQGRLRLAGLAEPIFDALREGAITLDVAMAYASTADIGRQAGVFENLAKAWGGNNPAEIRRQLSVGSYKGGDPRALLVGREAYIEAGGTVETDLFSDATDELWTDGALLDQLVAARLAAAAEEIRQREGYAAIRTVAASQPTFSETYGLRRVVGTPVPLTEVETRRCTAIKAKIAAIEQAADAAGDYSDEQQVQLDTLEEELGGLQDRPEEISDEQRASALAYVVIGPDGVPELHDQLYVAPVEAEDSGDAEGSADGQSHDEGDGSEAAVAAAKPVVSQRLGDELAMMRTELLALHVASDPHFALDLGIFFMAEAAIRAMGSSGLPTELRAHAPTPRAHGFVSIAPAAVAWSKLDDGLDRSWAEHEDVTARYDAFCALDDGARAAWLGWAIARTLHAVPAGKTGSALLDHLGTSLDIDVAAWWRPTAGNYFDRISKPAILALMDDIGGPELRSRYSAARKHDLAASAESLFAGQLIVDADVKARALAWVPDAMRFAPQSAPAGGDSDDETSATGPLTATGESDPASPPPVEGDASLDQAA